MVSKILRICIFVYTSVLCTSADHRIIGGEEVTIEQYPYLASVRYYDNHICGGAIVNNDHIITSAQCIEGLTLNQISVRVGATEHKNGQQISVRDMIVPKYFNKESKENDVAILKLSTALTFDNKVNKIILEQMISNDLSDSDGKVAKIIGWGVNNDNDLFVSHVLQKVDKTIISYYECNEKYGMNMVVYNMTCAQSTGKGICKGDVGSPLVINDKLFGIASWNYGCAQTEYPDVFTDTRFFYEWINQNI